MFKCWLAEEPIASSSSANMQRIREAVAVLSRPQPRQEDVQPLQNKWKVAQQKDKKLRSLQDVIQEFRDKVTEAVQRLQWQLADNAEQCRVARNRHHERARHPNTEHCRDPSCMERDKKVGHEIILCKSQKAKPKSSESAVKGPDPGPSNPATYPAQAFDCAPYSDTNLPSLKLSLIHI